MEIRCQQIDCLKKAKLSCTCDRKVRFCSSHFIKVHQKLSGKHDFIEISDQIKEIYSKIQKAYQTLEKSKNSIISKGIFMLNTIQSLIDKNLSKLIAKKIEIKNILTSGKDLQDDFDLLEEAVTFEVVGDPLDNFEEVIKNYIRLSHCGQAEPLTIEIKKTLEDNERMRQEILKLKEKFRAELNEPNKITDIFEKNKVSIEVIENKLKEVNPDGINFKEIVYENLPLYMHKSPKYSIIVYGGVLPDGSSIVLKSYKALISPEDLKPIYEEIKILTVVSYRASPDNCFLKFYGSYEQLDTIYLYMEAGESNLMDLISKWKIERHYPDIELLESWTVSLISSFAELSYLRIHHRDIKPHNIVVTKDSKLKIIDFSVSTIIEKIETTFDSTIQGTRSYMAPELEEIVAKGGRGGCYDLKKADVFSLGMTILQLMTYEDLCTLNIPSENSRLLELVKMIKGPNWIKVLLKNMLQLDPRSRPDFHQCLRFLPDTNITG